MLRSVRLPRFKLAYTVEKSELNTEMKKSFLHVTPFLKENRHSDGWVSWARSCAAGLGTAAAPAEPRSWPHPSRGCRSYSTSEKSRLILPPCFVPHKEDDG